MTVKRFLLLAFIVLQVLDVVSTMRFLSNGHAVEGNPLLVYAMNHMGSWWWITKVAMVLVVVPVLAMPRARVRYAAIMTGLYAFVVTNNFML